MALFKIFKGNSNNLPSKSISWGNGYAWFTQDDGKFYIDYYNGDDTLDDPLVDAKKIRQALNAEKADKDSDGNTINTTYLKKSFGTAAGDMLYWSGASTPTRLAAGTDGQVLQLDNGIPTWVDFEASSGVSSWNDLTDKPSTFPPESHTHGNITNAGELSTASYAVVTDANKKITVADLSVSTTTDSNDTTTRFVSSVTQNAQGQITVTTKPLPTYNNYSLPLAADGTRGGIQIGYITDAANRNYALQLNNEKAYVNVPWENTWRGIQDNLTSTSTTDSLSANQGKVLNDKINGLLAANDAMVFKGTIGDTTNPTNATIASLPTTDYQAGWTYRVVTAGTYLTGSYCEIGDLIIALNDGPSSGNTIIDSDWTIAQTNIDGAVYIGHAGSDVGSTTQPVYVNAAGEVRTTSYSLGASVGSGTNCIARYDSNGIITSSSHFASSTTLAVNANSVPSNTTLYVNGATSINGNLNVGKKLDVGWNDRANAAQFYTRILYDVRQAASNDRDTNYSEGNRLLWTDNNRVFCATSHYADATHLAINSTSLPTETLYVDGITRGTNNLFIGSSSTGNIRQIQVETAAGTINLNSGATNSATKGLSVTNASGTTACVLAVNQLNQISEIADFSCDLCSSTDGSNNLGTLAKRWNTLFVERIAFDTGVTTAAALVDYGSSTQPIYWHNGIPTVITSYSGNAATATGANLTTTQNALAYYSDTSGTFADSEIVIIPSSKHIGGWINGGQLAGTTLGSYATAEGYNTTASGNFTHAEGSTTLASGYCAHTEGSYTTASGYASHAEGESTYATNGYAHAEGYHTVASGAYSHAEGYYTTAAAAVQHVFGQYNESDTGYGDNPTSRGDYIEIVGNGIDSSRKSNARTLDWNGNERLAGGLLPMANNSQTLGSTTYKWQKLYIGTADSYGDAYTPIYWNSGTPAAVSPVQYAAFTIAANAHGVTLSHTAFTANSYVLQIVITSGGGSFNAPINWESSDSGWIKLTTTSAPTTDVTGYIIVARGEALTVTSTSIASLEEE